MVRISIIVPVFNVGNELPQTIASLRAQIFEDFEVVLVDDGSTDGCGSMCDAYMETDHRIKVIHQSNSGVVAARMCGFKHSVGEWILFVDGDDVLKENALSRIAAEIERTDPDIVQFEYDMVGRDGSKTYCLGHNGTYTTDELIAHMRKTPLEFLGMCIWNKCYRRSIVEKTFVAVGDVRISHSEDGLFAFAAFLNAKDIDFLQSSLYQYILRKGSAVHQINEKIVEEKDAFVTRLQELMLTSRRLTEVQQQRCIDFHCYQAACYIFLMLCQNKAGRREVYLILRKLNCSSFFNRKNKEWDSVKRMIMRLLLSFPFLYWRSRWLIDRVYN